MKLFVGLGNPGTKYARHRHNIGFMAVDEIIHRHSFGPAHKKFQGMLSEGRVGSEKVLILKPTTFMNESGRAVGEAMRFYKLAPEDVYVFYDELDLPAAKIKVKQGGGAAGHNGIRSTANHIGPDFWRIRLGIGHPGAKERVTGHVLGDFAKADQKWVEELLRAVSDEAALLADGKESTFANKVHIAINGKPERKPNPQRRPNLSAFKKPKSTQPKSNNEQASDKSDKAKKTQTPPSQGVGTTIKEGPLADMLRKLMGAPKSDSSDS